MKSRLHFFSGRYEPAYSYSDLDYGCAVPENSQYPVNTEWNSDGDKTKLVKSIIPLHDYIQGLALIEKGGRLVSKRY